MRSKQETTFDTKTGYIKKIKLTIFVDNLTLKPLKNSGLYLLDAIEKELIKDNRRALKEKALLGE